MIGQHSIAVMLAGVTGLAILAFTVGASALAAKFGGLWAAVTVGGFLIGSVTVILLYAFGETQRDQGRQERVR